MISSIVSWPYDWQMCESVKDEAGKAERREGVKVREGLLYTLQLPVITAANCTKPLTFTLSHFHTCTHYLRFPQ